MVLEPGRPVPSKGGCTTVKITIEIDPELIKWVIDTLIRIALAANP